MRFLLLIAVLLKGCFVPDYSAGSRLDSCVKNSDCGQGFTCVRGACLTVYPPEAGNGPVRQLDVGLVVDAGSTDLNATNPRVLSSSCGNSCLIKDANVFCMGAGEFGANGDGTNEDRDLPTMVSNLSGAVEVVSFDSGSCARLEDTTVWCWGLNSVGQLGDGSQLNSNIPVQVTNLSGIVSISGGRDHVCALNQSAEVWCWGGNAYGQIGNDSGADSQLSPVWVQSNVYQIDLGGFSTCTLKNDDTTWCWGQNDHGVVFDPARSQAVHQPTRMARGGHIFVEVRTGTHNACGRKGDGTVWCWGHNRYGEFGNSSDQDSLPPVQVPAVTDAIGVALAGYYRVCILRSDHTMWCSGINRRGSLGNGSQVGESVHKQVLDITNVITMARDGSCEANMARTADGQTYVWGENRNGNLGLGADAEELYTVPQRLNGF